MLHTKQRRGCAKITEGHNNMNFRYSDSGGKFKHWVYTLRTGWQGSVDCIIWEVEEPLRCKSQYLIPENC